MEIGYNVRTYNKDMLNMMNNLKHIIDRKRSSTYFYTIGDELANTVASKIVLLIRSWT
jgi:hypothetical protein